MSGAIEYIWTIGHIFTSGMIERVWTSGAIKEAWTSGSIG
jgi:hypothetical protein